MTASSPGTQGRHVSRFGRLRWSLTLLLLTPLVLFASMWHGRYADEERAADHVRAAFAVAGHLLNVTGWTLLAAAAVTGLTALLPDVAGTPRKSAESARRRAVALPIVGFVVGSGSIAAGVMDTLVWLPRALAPGYDLAAIYDAIGSASVTMTVVHVSLWAAVWVSVFSFGLVLAIRLIARGVAPLKLVAALFAASIGVALLFLFFASFSIGMDVADALPPFGGGQSVPGMLLYGFGQLMLATTIVLLVPPWNGRASAGTAEPNEADDSPRTAVESMATP